MKDQNTVIEEFNDIVNMTAPELETWFKSDDSQSAGWPKGDDGTESVGHDSGRNIISILKSNPDKDPDKYTEDHIQHMRKVVSYCKRHLAQEEKSNREKSTQEVKKTKSYASLKNWGHDILKKNKGGKEATGDDHETDNGDGEQQTGDKRKADDRGNGANKKRETEKGRAAGEEDDDEELDEEDGKGEKEGKGEKKGKRQKRGKGQNQGADDEEQEKENNNKNDKASDKLAKGPKPGETVSWDWGNGRPEGKVLDVKGEKTTVETKNGNQVSRKGDAEDPAVVIDAGKSKAVKLAHELN
ncbi:DNA-binding protein [Ophiocordyceps sinensis CO18]|uniref:DNA-binding protein n=1 Tax=Ophiocordyceps sinensis (strain Co18 / CGMCC 3.14243) TaxID=911162 RepID=T5AI10_OPHSC|nr:DNA-binding protein [Ophiocordyceps sinensis CO18]